MSVKIIAFDIDGTLLYDDKTIPAENLRALELAAKKGILLVPASGRTYTAMPKEIISIPGVRYCIGANGAQVYDLQEQKCIYSAELPLELALDIYRYGDTQGVCYDCYQDNRGFMTRWMYDAIDDIVDIPGILYLIKTVRTPVDELKAHLAATGKSLQKAQFYTKDMEKKARMLKELREMFPETCVTSSLPMNIEINSAGASKGQALAALCKYLGIGIEDSMSLGDGSNDTDMIAAAGIGVAMGNATPEVKAAADYITDTNMNDGFAKAIYKFI